jgi:hypothetical protein
MSRKFAIWLVVMLLASLWRVPSARAWLPSDPPPGPTVPPPLPSPGPVPEPPPPPPPTHQCHDTPEPSTLMLALCGASALGLRLVRRRRDD